ncbi:MAG: hypothetical protein ABIR34_07085 [Marmoricola sp.]
MINAGMRPLDRVERARVRAERARQDQGVESEDGPPEVGQQRVRNQPLEGAIDIVIKGTPAEPQSDEWPVLSGRSDS